MFERTSRCVVLIRLDGFTKQPRSVPVSLGKTLTDHQGSEIALPETLAKRLKMSVCCCDPHSPWPRAAHEDAKGLTRDHLPKGTKPGTVSAADLGALEVRLAGRPRQILRLQNQDEVFSSLKLNMLIDAAREA